MKTKLLIAALTVLGMGASALAAPMQHGASQAQFDGPFGGGFGGGHGPGGGWGGGHGGPGGGHGGPGGPGGGWGGGHGPGGGHGGGGGVMSVQCESISYQQAYCSTGPARAVNLSRQLSDGRGACIEGRSWGFDGRGIWVNNGCRGIFNVIR